MAEYIPYQILTAAELNASIDGLSATITTVAASVAAEASTRAAADTTEATARAAGDTAEATARAAAVSGEIAARSAADLALITPAMRPFSLSSTVLAATNLLQIQNAASGGALRSMVSKVGEIVSVTDFGADPTFTVDSTAAFNNAVTASKFVFIPPGKYLIAGLITMPQDGGVLLGAGVNATNLVSNQTTGNMLTCPLGLDILTVGGFTMSRSVVPTSGAGIAPSTINQMVIHDVRSQGQWIGFNLPTCAAGTVIDCTAQQNYSHGFYLSNDATHNSIQWTLINCLSQENNGWGFAAIGTVNTAGTAIPLSPWIGCSTFANTAGGVIVQGSSTAQLWDFSANGCWFGSDNYNEMLFDTYGGQHFVRDCYMELAGQEYTGVSFTTAPTHTGNGVEITANNADVNIMNCGMSSVSFDGVNCSDNHYTLVSGCVIVNVGLAGGSYGSVVNSGVAHITVTGCRLGSSVTGATSQFGISVLDGALLTAVGNDLRANSLGAIAMTSNYNQANISANQGYISRWGGQVTLPAGQSSVTVAHNLSLAAGQTPIQLNVTPLSQLASGVQVWSDTFTQTTFKINVSASNGGNTFFAVTAGTSEFN